MHTSKDLMAPIKEAIRIKMENTFANHFKTYRDRDEDLYRGMVYDKKFQIWRYTSGAMGIHPVITGELEVTSEVPELRISSKMNPFGVFLLVSILIVLGVLTIFILPKDIANEMYNAIIILLSTMVIPTVLIWLIYRFETKSHMEEIKEMIEAYPNNVKIIL